jgi:NADH-quinone oxidoreductase subunit N
MFAQVPGGLATPDIAWSAFAPELVLGGAALVLLLLIVAERVRLVVAVPVGIGAVALGAWLVDAGLTFPGGVAVALGAGLVATVVGLGGLPRLVLPFTAALATAGALALTGWQAVTLLGLDGGATASTTFGGSVAVDGLAVFTRLTVLVTTLLVIPLGHGYLVDRGIARAEFEPLLLLSATGMMLLGAANDLITLFVSLEVLSIALYVLAGIARRDRRSQESALKYFVLGAVASAILLYGMALLYVATGSLELPGIGLALGLLTTPARIAVLGLALVTVGIGFKIAMVPFQLWTPDVYQGAPTNVTAFMAAATKAAGFAAVLRLYLVAFGRLDDLWAPVLAVLAAATMLYGAVGALVQRDVKRILAYSSIAHAGYALVGVVSASAEGLSGTLWYLLTYAVATIAGFGVVIAVERRRRGEVALVDLRGLGRTSPGLAGVLALSLLSLAGIPPTAGFVGKLVVFQAGVAAGYEWLVVIGVLTSVVAGFFYLRLIGAMFLEEPEAETETPTVTTGLSVATSVSALLVVYLGIQPELLLDLARVTTSIVR